MACTPDTITPKGVTINLNSGSDYTNCTVYTGLTDSVITGATNCIDITGPTCTLTGLSATLMEVFVRIDCEGCCSNTFRVNLDECCGDIESTPTPTPTTTSSVTPTPTPTITSTPSVTPTSSVCVCNTYRIQFNGNCGEFLNWTDCETGNPMSEQAGFFPQYSGTPNVFGDGTVLYLCSCSVPSASCNISIDLISVGCVDVTPTPTPTSTSTPTETPITCVCYTLYYTPPITGSTFIGITNYSYTDCNGAPQTAGVQDTYPPVDVCAQLDTISKTSGDGVGSWEIAIYDCCVTPTPTPTPTLTSSGSCDCNYYDIVISQSDIDNSDDGYVYVAYNDCGNNAVVVPYGAAGVYLADICVINSSIPSQYYLFDGLSNLTLDTPINTLDCCGIV